MSIEGKWKAFLEMYEELFHAKYRRMIKKAHRDEEDLFLLLCYCEMLGIPNPVSYYTLELYPVIYERFHEWHKRMGMEKSPLDGIHCC
jgi:hypothetical protein